MLKIFKILKKVTLAAFFIYGFNIFAQSLNIMIPLNLISISYITFFGVPGLISLIIIYIFAF